MPGKLDKYLALKGCGLNTIELDVKDENGEVGFARPAVPLARQVGAAQGYYDPRAGREEGAAAGVYLIGRVVVFEDPRLGRDPARHGDPDARRRRLDDDRPGSAGRTRTTARVWDYNVDIAEAAARAGFDEIMFDYVRFPTDGVVAGGLPRALAEPKWQVIADFVEYAPQRLRPLGVRVSAAVFGLAATRDLGIGQRPRLLAKHLDAIYPMVYPSHLRLGRVRHRRPRAPSPVAR